MGVGANKHTETDEILTCPLPSPGASKTGLYKHPTTVRPSVLTSNIRTDRHE